MSKTKVISVASFKGGTGKTLITFNLAALLAQNYDKNILIIDVDPQHNSTHLFAKSYERGIEDIFNSDMVGDDLHPTEVIQSSHLDKIDIIPSSIRLIKTEAEVTTQYGKEFILQRWFNEHSEYLSKYDYVFLDTNPTMSTINVNSFLVSDSVILLSDVDIDSLIAIETFIDSYSLIQHKIRLDQDNNVKGILVNKLKETTKMDRDFLEFINSEKFKFKDLVLDTFIHEAVALRETKATRLPIAKASNQRAYNEFIELIEELKGKGVL